MQTRPRHLDRFLAALHRRLILVRVLECAGLGALVGCAVAAVLIPVLLWRQRPALPPSIGLLAAGAAAGLAWGIARRPNRLQAAAEADRQLGLADLLGTALTVAPRSRESDRDAEAGPWLASVLSLADAATRAHAPSDVILHRVHARAWGGIVLAAALVLSLAALFENQPRADASANQVAGASQTRVAQTRALKETTGAALRTQRGTPAPAARATAEASPDRELPGATSEDSDDGAAAERSATPDGRSASSGDDGAGGGNAKSNRPPASERSPWSPDAVAARPAEQGNVAAGGAGVGRADQPPGGADVAGSSGGASAPTSATPPWRSAAWSDDVARANAAVKAGRVPASHRDLVREYFDRP